MATFPRSLSSSRRPRAIAVAALIALFLLPATGFAQSRRGRGDGPRAVPRSRSTPPPRVYAPAPHYHAPVRPYYRTYRPSVNLGFFYGAPGFYGVYRYGNPYWGYPYGSAYPSRGWIAPYGYGYYGYSGRPYGGLRIDLPQRDAEVLVDGYFVGTVDNFDGVFQQANLEAGPHRVEIRDPDFEPLTFEVNVQPGRTITYRGSLRPLR